MKALFNVLTVLSVQFRVVTLALIVLILVLGGVAATELKQELLPPVEFPQTIILAQVSGMTSEQVLSVMTERLEQELSQIETIVNIETTTTGSFGVVVSASNDFGLDQQQIKADIQAALDRIWLPERHIRPSDELNSGDFARELLADLSVEHLVFLADESPNFLFQLRPEVWEALDEPDLRQLLAHLAKQEVRATSGKSALQRLVEQEIAPQLEALDTIARVEINGGQPLPGAETAVEVVALEDGELSSSRAVTLLSQLSDEVWNGVSTRLNLPDSREDAIEQLRSVDFDVPETPPALPESWRYEGFRTAEDLLEMVTVTRSLGTVFNEFVDTGRISGALGQTDDLTPEIVIRLLTIEPSLVHALEAEHLVAMSPEVFSALPEEYVSNLDGFTRDALAASALARVLTGREAVPESVDLPSAWRIQPPQIINFSFADLPLATFSIFTTDVSQPVVTNDMGGNGGTSEVGEPAAIEDRTQTAESTSVDSPSVPTPEGPALPALYGIVGEFFGADLNTVDDLLSIELTPEFADQFGSPQLSAADFLNAITLFGDSFTPNGVVAGGDLAEINITDFVQPLVDCGVGLLDIASGDFDFATTLISCLSPDQVNFLIDNDPGFVDSLQPDVINRFATDVYAQTPFAPILSDTWTTLAQQPELDGIALRTADDLIKLGNGSAAVILNEINEHVPDGFAGYEVRLLDSLSPRVIEYLRVQEEDFLDNLSDDVIVKFSPDVLETFPEDDLTGLSAESQVIVQEIVSGERPSAADRLESLYVADAQTEPSDPSAPLLGPTWQFIVQFVPGVDALDNASDLLRFEDAIESPADFINSFLSGQGARLAPDLVGELSLDAVNYIAERDENFLNDLEPLALQYLAPEVFSMLPPVIQARAEDGEIFVPSTQVTRTNGAASLLVTVYKPADVNTVDAFYAANEVIERINAENDSIEVQIAFEQSSFIEESISGVVREGSLGAFFAIINILIFLSGGIWGRSGRSIVGFAVIGAAVTFIILLLVGADVGGVGLQLAWDQADPLFRVIGVLGIVAGFAIIVWPGRLPYPAWRSTIVIGISIPLSVFAAIALMRWLPLFLNGLFSGAAETSPIFEFLLRLAPDDLTLNIMTLSGLTVAIGRVVDDSIVVLENIYREIQRGVPKREAIISGTRDVSLAIFSATMIAVVVFLPLGLTGGLVGEFFLPFGLAVTYALASSFLVAITVVPALASIFISTDEVHEDSETWFERLYVPVLKYVLATKTRRRLVIAAAFVSVFISVLLFGTRPLTFLPDFGEPQVSVSVSMPEGTTILETNELVLEMTDYIEAVIPPEDRSTIRETVGGGGFSFEALFGGGGVSENRADITVTLRSADLLDVYPSMLRDRAEELFGSANVTVSGGTLTSEGFSGFELVASGPDQAVLEALDPQIIAVLGEVEGIANVESNLSQAEVEDENAPVTYIRVNQRPALSYTAELETEDTIGLTQRALEAIEEQIEIPDGVTIGQGFDSEIQTEGFASLFVAMGIALVIVILILIFVFGSPIYWMAIIFSVIVAPVGAAIALTLTDRVLGISALIGLLMLLGLVITNAVVLIDRVNQNRSERNMGLYDSLVEAGGRRLRPILMTTLATIIALIPLSLGLSEGAIIAKELGTVVIGGVLSSMLLTLIVVPAAYYLLTPLNDRFSRLTGLRNNDSETLQKQ